MYEAVGETVHSPERIQLQLLRARRITAEQLAAAYAELATRESEEDVVDVLLEQGHVSPAVLSDFRAMAEHRSHEQSGPGLLRKFLRSLGLEPSELSNREPLPETAHCIDEYHQLSRSSSWQEALAAIAIGAEWLLPSLYELISRAIGRSGVVPMQDGAFFARQVEQSQNRGTRVIKALTPYADSPDSRRRIASGIRRALLARQRWYDGLTQLLFGHSA